MKLVHCFDKELCANEYIDFVLHGCVQNHRHSWLCLKPITRRVRNREPLYYKHMPMFVIVHIFKICACHTNIPNTHKTL